MASNTNQPKDAFDAFSSVDKLVSKPILGSDGAASWQEFRKENKTLASKKNSSAPLAPLKKADKLGTGLQSWNAERQQEVKSRKETGSAALGEGYTEFHQKNAHEEAAQRKERKRIEAKIRPDDKEYFIKASTFEGWKFDYVFTTRETYGTGYYFDGTDSIKKLNGDDLIELSSSNNQTGKHKATLTTIDNSEEEPKKKKRKKKTKAGPVFVETPNHPLEQVRLAIQKRNERLAGGNNNEDTLPKGWECAVDPSSKNVYYFHRESNTRQWDKPKFKEPQLPEGWKSVKDAKTGKFYYYHTSGETRWERPE